MSQENMWKIGHPELDISTVEIISVMKWGNEQTDRNTQNLKLFRTSVQTSKKLSTDIPGVSPKNFKKIAHLELDISKINLISVSK